MAWAEKIKSGYRGRYLDKHGTKQTAGDAPTRKEAIALGQKEEHKIRAGTWVDPKNGRTTFTEYFEQTWFPNLTLELHTRRSYWSNYHKHLQPAFGDRELRSITSTVVQRWVTTLIEAEYHPTTIAKLHITLQTVLAGRSGLSAKRDKYIEVNPCEGTRLPPIPVREVTIYEPDEVARLVIAMDPWWRLRVGDFSLGFTDFDVRRAIVEISPDWPGNDTAFAEKHYPKGRKPRSIAVHKDLRPPPKSGTADPALRPEPAPDCVPLLTVAVHALRLHQRVLGTWVCARPPSG